MLWPRGANIIYVAWVASVQTPLCRRMRSKLGSSANLSFWLSMDYFCTFSIVFRHFYGKTFCILSVDICICAFTLYIYIYIGVCVCVYIFTCRCIHIHTGQSTDYTDSSMQGSFSMHTCTCNRHTLLAPRKGRVLNGRVQSQNLHIEYDPHSPPRDRCIT